MSTPATKLKHTTHAVNSWHTMLRRAFVEVPAMIRQTQRHRGALASLIHKHGGK